MFTKQLDTCSQRRSFKHQIVDIDKKEISSPTRLFHSSSTSNSPIRTLLAASSRLRQTRLSFTSPLRSLVRILLHTAPTDRKSVSTRSLSTFVNISVGAPVGLSADGDRNVGSASVIREAIKISVSAGRGTC